MTLKFKIVDYGSSNLRSVYNAINRLDVDCGFALTPNDLREADAIVLPGVGAFAHAMENLNSSGLRDALENEVMNKGKPFLGICLGMQIMCLSSEEGIEDGLGWINARVKSFKSIKNPPRILPHMGWNKVECRKESKLTYNFNDDTRFYFVHSYFVDCLEPSDVLLSTEYGMNFASAFNVGNIYGVQFHPEKSHLFGAKLMTRFGEL